MNDAGMQPIPFHVGQQLCYDSTSRYNIISAGSQSGKTSWSPYWLYREIYGPTIGKGHGDYLAVTATYDLFKLKMLPALLDVFEGVFNVGRYWAGAKIIELRDPISGEFWAKRSDDTMWGRIILRSADALGGLESSTASAAWLDECGAPSFIGSAYNAVRRRLSLQRGRTLMTTTIYTYNWFLERIIKPIIATGVTKYIEAELGDVDLTVSEDKNATLVQFDSTLNPLFSREEYEEAHNELSEEEFSMFYRGREASRRFLIYDNFDIIVHTCVPFAIPLSWRRYAGLDFGGTHLVAIKYAEHPDSKTLYAYEEYRGGKQTVKDYVNDILLNEVKVPVAFGGAKGETQWRREFSQHGLKVLEPMVSEVDVGIARVYAQHNQNGIIYFNTLSGIITEKGSYRRKRNSEGDITNEIYNKGAFHFLDAERYIVSSIRSAGTPKMKVRRISIRTR